MITATHEQIREILKTLPIGYYLGERTPVLYEERGDSYCNLMDGTIHVSGETVMHGLANLPADTDPYEMENAIRAILYHELSHVIMTPKTKVYKWLNTFEDERIETLLSKYYLGVNFKKMCMAVNGWTKDWMPEDAETYFYGICRFRQGPEKFVKKVAELIRKWKTLRADASEYRAGDYRDDVKRFYDQVCDDWYQNHQQRQQEQEQRNEQRQQEQEQRDQQKQQGQQGNQGGSNSQDGEQNQDQQQGGGQQSGDKQEQDKGGKNAQGKQAGKDKSNGKDKQDESNGSGDKKDKPEQGEGAGDSEDGQEENEGDQNDQSEGNNGGGGTDGDENADADDQNGQPGHGKSSKNRGKDAKEQERGKGDQGGSEVNESTEQDSSKGSGSEGEDAEEDGDLAEEEITGRVGADNEEEINEITRESIARDFQKLLNKFHEEQVGRTLERLIIQHNKKRASRTPMSRGYTGKVDFKSVATRQDYRWFSRKGGDGEKKFGSTHLTLWVDCSGSFCEDIHRINSVIHELNRLARRLGRDFSFDVVQMTMKNEVVPTTVQLEAMGCNGFGPGVEECIRKTRKQGCNNYNVVVWDGDMFSGFYSSTQNRWLPVLNKAFNNQNTVIVSDGENKGYLDRQCPKARTRIIHGRYAEQFVDALLALLAQVLV